MLWARRREEEEGGREIASSLFSISFEKLKIGSQFSWSDLRKKDIGSESQHCCCSLKTQGRGDARGGKGGRAQKKEKESSPCSRPLRPLEARVRPSRTSENV